MKTVTVRTPCSTANLGPGFDCIGLALGLYNEITFTEIDDGFQLTVGGEGQNSLPLDASNLVYCAAQKVFKKVDYRPNGLKIHLENKIPIASGMGSSSSAIVAGMVCANALAGSPLSTEELLQLAVDIEGHPDNVAPTLYGGLIVGVLDNGAVTVDKIDMPSFQVSVVLPLFKLLTSEARAALPIMIPRSDAIYNIGRAALLVHALHNGHWNLLRKAMQDKLHQPYRFPLIPGSDQAMKLAYEAGAAGIVISGAGPSLAIFGPGDHAPMVAAVREAFSAEGFGARHWTLDVDHHGAQVISETN